MADLDQFREGLRAAERNLWRVLNMQRTDDLLAALIALRDQLGRDTSLAGEGAKELSAELEMLEVELKTGQPDGNRVFRVLIDPGVVQTAGSPQPAWQAVKGGGGARPFDLTFS